MWLRRPPRVCRENPPSLAELLEAEGAREESLTIQIGRSKLVERKRCDERACQEHPPARLEACSRAVGENNDDKRAKSELVSGRAAHHLPTAWEVAECPEHCEDVDSGYSHKRGGGQAEPLAT